jgi:hypothetical protein
MSMVKDLGVAATQSGWRKQAAEKLAPAGASRTRFGQDEIRAALGFVFLALSVKYLVGTATRFRDRTA